MREKMQLQLGFVMPSTSVDNWDTDIRQKVLERDGNTCKHCGADNFAVGYRDEDGYFYDTYYDMGANYQDGQFENYEDAKAFADKENRETGKYLGIEYFVIELIITRINDPNPANINLDNLAALCQRCHEIQQDRNTITLFAQKMEADNG